jgi:predicted flap endonuclease-1-like 5' DNA nuclease
LEGIVTYDSFSRTATFTPDKGDTANPMQPDQEFGNVFTATITTGAKDLEGNSLSQNYLWSFSTGNNPYNTGESTSQQLQTAVPVTTPTTTKPSTTVAPITGAVTGAQATTNNSSWNWIIGGLILIALIALVTSFVVNTNREKSKKTVQVSRPNPFGDIHPVQDIEGIGSEYNKALLAMGIADTKQLWNANAAKVAKTTGAPLVSVKSWQNMAELAAIHDIGPQYAELLERSGIHNISQLRTCKPNQLLKLVREKQKSINMNIQGNTPGHALVENWIDQARNHVHVSEGLTA